MLDYFKISIFSVGTGISRAEGARCHANTHKGSYFKTIVCDIFVLIISHLQTAEVEGQRSALHAVNADIHKAQSDLMERECMQQQRLAVLAAEEEALAAMEEAEAEVEAMTVAAATARANELANIVVHDSYRIDIDLVHSDDEQGPTSMSNEIAVQTTSTFTTQVFQTPAPTFPVPYSNLPASLDTVNKTKVSKLEIEIMDQIPPSPPSGSLKQVQVSLYGRL